MKTLKIYTPSSIISSKYKIISQIGESKKSIIIECYVDLSNDKNVLVVDNTKSDIIKDENKYIIKLAKEIGYDNNKEFSYLANNVLGDNIIYGICSIGYKNNNVKSLILKKIEGITIDKIDYSNIDVLELLDKINDKIDYLHNNFIFHNDLILANIILNNDNANIIDYGESLCYYEHNISDYFINKEISDKLNNGTQKINGIFYGLNETFSSYFVKKYSCFFKFIDKFMITTEVFKKYYFANTFDGRIDKMNLICNNFDVMDLNYSCPLLLRFIFDFNIMTRMNYPVIMLLLKKRKMLNPIIDDHIHKLHLIITENNYQDLFILKQNKNEAFNTLYNNTSKIFKKLSTEEYLLLFLIYYSFIVYSKHEERNEKFIIKPLGLLDFIVKIFKDNEIFVLIKKYYQKIENKVNIVYDTSNNIDLVICKIISEIINVL